ncbi:glutathione S-transferase family protein [Oceanicoccus sagamiensis]|uniref:Glutathione S-transferase n=1 Tax=Oceanicoccus sagamiensis TaxID=716816 RepID=A0A1X9N3K5_9GAMM|nr:glutathione S-transferase family protein [Oceanicoccus sagamiensis]ARN72778.1 glutathione S-transferase [Oceanicoccus sagamiensis]
MKLYTFEIAPNPRRLKLFMQYKGIAIETETINIGEKEQFAESYKAINPSCTVPTLVLDDGSTLIDVISACLYLESVYPDKPLLGSSPLEQAQIVGWDHKIFVEGLTAVAEMLRNRGEFFQGRGLPGGAEVEQIPALIERGQKRLQAFFQVLEANLAERDYLVGDGISLADIDAFVLCDFAGWVKESIPEDCTQLQSWYQRVGKELGE